MDPFSFQQNLKIYEAVNRRVHKKLTRMSAHKGRDVTCAVFEIFLLPKSCFLLWEFCDVSKWCVGTALCQLSFSCL